MKHTLCLFLLFPLALWAQTPAGITFPVQTLTPHKGRLPQVAANPYADRWERPAWATFRPGLDSLVNLSHDNPDEFIYTVKLAYAGHYPLVLSPDVIWYLIFRGFSGHVTYMAKTDSLRRLIIRRPGEEKIRITLRDTLAFLPPDSLLDWPGMIQQFRAATRREFQPAFDSLVSPRFSTTTAFQQSVQDAALLACVKDYFDMRMGIGFLCGIPAITLEGTPADWRDIRRRTEALGTYGMDWWLDDLLPVLDQFVAASEGRADTLFWQGMYKAVPSIYWGCADQPNGSGWVGVFFPYAMADGQPEPNLRLKNNDFSLPVDESEFELGFSSLPLGIAFEFPAGTEFREYELQTGFGGRSQDAATLALRPELKLLATLYMRERELVPEAWVRRQGDRQVLVAERVGWKRLTSVPRTLPGLNALNARDNKIRRIPPALIRMRHLDTLRLAENQLSGAGYGQGREDRYGWEKQRNVPERNYENDPPPSPYEKYYTYFPPARAPRLPMRTSLRYVDLSHNRLESEFVASLPLWRPRHHDTLIIDLRHNYIDTLPEALAKVRYPLVLLLSKRDWSDNDFLPGPALPPHVQVRYPADPVEENFDNQVSITLSEAPAKPRSISIGELQTCQEPVFLPNPNEGFFDGEIIEEEYFDQKSIETEVPDIFIDMPKDVPKD